MLAGSAANLCKSCAGRTLYRAYRAQIGVPLACRKTEEQNISLSEEREFKALAVSYAQLSEDRLLALLELEELVEICHGDDS